MDDETWEAPRARAASNRRRVVGVLYFGQGPHLNHFQFQFHFSIRREEVIPWVMLLTLDS